MKQHFAFDCAGAVCAATLDLPEGEARSTGLLIVSGGNEIRSGAHQSQAHMAAHFSALGYIVMRYDRRGVGESEGDNRGFRNSAQDMAAAAAAFRAQCGALTRITGFGNCDGASALALFARQAGLDAIICANPWTYDHDGESDVAAPQAAPVSVSVSVKPDAAHAKSYYVKRLANPLALAKDILGGKVNFGKLTGGLKAVAAGEQPSETGARLADALTDWGDGAAVLLATEDRTAIQFESQMKLARFSALHMARLNSSAHSFADDNARTWLYTRVMEILVEYG